MGDKQLGLEDGRTFSARAVVIAIGAQFQRAEFPGSDSDDVVYGNAAQIRARTDVGDPVVIVGGWDGPGQAAVHLANRERPVILLSCPSLREEMSQRLIDQLKIVPNVTVMEGAEIASADVGPTGRMRSVALMDGQNPSREGRGPVHRLGSRDGVDRPRHRRRGLHHDRRTRPSWAGDQHARRLRCRRRTGRHVAAVD